MWANAARARPDRPHPNRATAPIRAPSSDPDRKGRSAGRTCPRLVIVDQRPVQVRRHRRLLFHRGTNAAKCSRR